MATRISTWLKRGFLPEEAAEFSRISAAGTQAPYIQAMVRKRLSLNAARVRYHWSKRTYRLRIAQEYKNKGVSPQAAFPGLVSRKKQSNLIWDYFNAWKWIAPAPDEWTSPKRKRKTTMPSKRSPQTTKRGMLKDKISRLNDQISRAALSNNKPLRRSLELQRNRHQIELDLMG